MLAGSNRPPAKYQFLPDFIIAAGILLQKPRGK
jgi:hypothetical protein